MPANSNAITAAKPGALASLANLPAAMTSYFQDLQGEMRRVSWPTSKQVRATTAVVIAAVFLFSAYFAVVDFILGRAVNQIFEALAKR